MAAILTSYEHHEGYLYNSGLGSSSCYDFNENTLFRVKKLCCKFHKSKLLPPFATCFLMCLFLLLMYFMYIALQNVLQLEGYKKKH